MTTRLATAGVAAAALALAGCASSDPGPGSSGGSGIDVVATTTVWGDIAGQIVACAGSGQVTTLMPLGADPHDFTPSSKDVASMAGSDLVLANGLGLEEGLEDALDAVARDGARVLELGPQLDPVPFDADEEHADEEHADEDHADEDHADEDHADEDHADEDHGHDGDDPHVWLDIARVATAAGLIGAELAEVTGNQAYAACGDDLSVDLATLNQQEVGQTLAAVPADLRILVTDHDAFGYFAEAYGFEVAGVVIPGGSTLAKPSSAELADLTAVVRDTGVPAIFSNTANPQALVEALAAEVGDIEVVELYVGSLGEPGSGADTYQGMMRTNAQRISEALAG